MRCLAIALLLAGACNSRFAGRGSAELPPPDAAGDASEAPRCDAVACSAPGHACRGADCVADCRAAAATPCARGRACDSVSGACVARDARCAVVGTDAACGAIRCGAGSACDGAGGCLPDPPCLSVDCDGARCWGAACACERPAPACAVAPLDALNQPAFIGGGDGGAVDLEFDPSCNAWIVTVISGPDYLRRLAPDGTVTTWTGVSNLDMGEVAVLRWANPDSVADEGDVALTYTCCFTCGCASTPPQGVARLIDSDLPLVIEAQPSSGTGPFHADVLDAGPQGLTWGRDLTLYVGNVRADGDWVRADLRAGTVDTLAMMPARVYAAASFDPTTLLVAVAGGAVLRIDHDGGEPAPWATFDAEVTSLVRDPFTGHVYVETAAPAILDVAPDGRSVESLATPAARGRIALGPDGALYHLAVGYIQPAVVTRIDLPSTR